MFNFFIKFHPTFRRYVFAKLPSRSGCQDPAFRNLSARSLREKEPTNFYCVEISDFNPSRSTSPRAIYILLDSYEYRTPRSHYFTLAL